MIIKTERLKIRPISIMDSKDMYAYAKDPIIGQMAGWEYHKSEEETKTVIAFLAKLDTFSLIYNDTMVGTIGLTKLSDKTIIGYTLGKEYWNQGLMHEALKAVISYLFTKTDAHTLEATTYLDNLKSQRVLKKLGFQFMGIEDVEIKGQLIKIHTYKLEKHSFIKGELPWQ